MSWENLELITISCKTMLCFLRDWNCLWSAYGIFFCQHWVIIVVTLEPSPAIGYFWCCSHMIGIVEMPRYFSLHFCSGRWYPVSFRCTFAICISLMQNLLRSLSIFLNYIVFFWILTVVVYKSFIRQYVLWVRFFFVLCLSLPPDSHW